MRTVELVQAFVWTCDECGRDQFERALRIEPESIEASAVATFVQEAIDQIGEISDALGLEFSNDWTVAPKEVECKNCGSKFVTEG